MDAPGIVDEELIDAVGYAFLARCQSILQATDAHAGRIICPECGALESCARGKRGIAARCSIASNAGGMCAGSTISKATNTSILFGGGAVALHVEYVECFKAAATTPQQKMLAIDQLIHAYHRELVHAPGWSAVRELIYASIRGFVEVSRHAELWRVEHTRPPSSQAGVGPQVGEFYRHRKLGFLHGDCPPP
jgi:hypothetical protein